MKKLTIISLIFFACATMQSIPIDDRSTIIDADFNIVFKAVISCFTENGYVINNMDKELGLIDTDYKSGSAWAALFAGDTRTKMNAILTSVDSTKTKVTLTITSEEKELFGGWRAKNITGGSAKEVYNQYLQIIKEKSQTK